MRIRSALALVALAALLAVPVATADHSDRVVVATARGNVRWTIALPNPFGVEVGNRLTFNARKRADGTATGKIHYIQVVEGESFEFRIDVTCMGLYDGNRAKIGGLITSSNDPTVPAGAYGWFQVFDLNGGGRGPDEGPADRSSLVGFGDETANQAFCDSPNLPRFGPWDVEGKIDIEP